MRQKCVAGITDPGYNVRRENELPGLTKTKQRTSSRPSHVI
jgi:hypothetical protein